MDDKFIYYIILGAIYLISRMLKKKKPAKPILPRQQQVEEENYYESEPQSRAPVPQKPASFQDLLKEISQEFSDRKEPETRIEEIVEPVEVIEPIPEKETLTREQKYVARRHREIAAEDREKEIKRLKEEEEEHEPHTVLELLQEDGGAANAVILSEIINRRY